MNKFIDAENLSYVLNLFEARILEYISIASDIQGATEEQIKELFEN